LLILLDAKSTSSPEFEPIRLRLIYETLGLSQSPVANLIDQLETADPSDLAPMRNAGTCRQSHPTIKK
jgi:hypothetical protein